MTRFANRFRAIPLGLALASLAVSCAQYGDCPEGRLRDDVMMVCYIPCPDGQVDDERHETCTPASEAGMDGGASSRTDGITTGDAGDDTQRPSMDAGSAPTPPASAETADGGGAAARPPMTPPPTTPAGAMSCAASPTPDGCCPKDGNALTDPDCAPRCGNGIREGKELCDGTDCVSTCDTSNACLVSHLTGSAATCDAACAEAAEITQCKSGDGCCARGCTHAQDSDCSKSCGDGIVDAPELCEPSSKDKPCPSSCDDGNACTTDLKTGTPEQCNVACSHVAITAAKGGDGCCPPSTNANNDSDCKAICGNDVLEGSELCDGNCPTSCDDGMPCTKDSSSGSAESCNLACSHTPITTAKGGDGCCPTGANANNDSDCSAMCGNGVREGSELCDGSDCPTATSCADNEPCTADTVTGEASRCNATCKHTPITSPRASDGCCPQGANANSDNDCKAACGNGIREGSETCDGSDCPTENSCADNDPCTADTITGEASRCSARCEHSKAPAGTPCGNGRMCTSSGSCEAPPAECGNGMVEPGENCDDGRETWTCFGNCTKNYAYLPCTSDTDCSGKATLCKDGVCSALCTLGAAPQELLRVCPVAPSVLMGSGGSVRCLKYYDPNGDTYGVCRPACSSDSQCPPGTHCDGAAPPTVAGQCIVKYDSPP